MVPKFPKDLKNDLKKSAERNKQQVRKALFRFKDHVTENSVDILGGAGVASIGLGLICQGEQLDPKIVTDFYTVGIGATMTALCCAYIKNNNE